MVSRRPIVFYENLMTKYDAQVTALMLAKTSYVLLADTSDQSLPLVNLDELPAVKPAKKAKATKKKAPAKSRQPKATAKTATPADETDKAAPELEHQRLTTGLGLSLDDILSEEANVAANAQAKDDRSSFFDEH